MKLSALADDDGVRHDLAYATITERRPLRQGKASPDSVSEAGGERRK
jgi:hypothetical protein